MKAIELINIHVRFVVSVGCLLLMISCGSTKSPKISQPDLRPEWLKATPNNPVYYHGIGHGLKNSNDNYIQTAKKSALEDIASEIKVNVQSTSVLSQLDRDKEFQSQYEQIIQTTATEELEDFEQVDAWEDELHYWVYYRLSKERYREIKETKKRNAVSLALDFFIKARQAEQSKEWVTGLSFYYQGFRSLEEYLGEPIRIEYEGENILLINEILSHLQDLLNSIELSLNTTELTINRRMIKNESVINVKAMESSSRQPVVGLPLMAVFEKGGGDLFPHYKTDDQGHAKILITKITAQDVEQRISISLNPASFSGNQNSKIYDLVSSKLEVPKVTLLLKVTRPLVYINAEELSLGKASSTQPLTNAIVHFLNQSGFDITPNLKEAELSIDIIANTEKGNQSGSVFTTYLSATVRATSLADKKEIYVGTLNRIKGFSLDYERSSLQAYNEGLSILEEQKLPELLNSLLK